MVSPVGLLAEPLAEPPARPPNVSDPKPSYTRRAGSGAERYLTRPLTPCVYCNLGSGFDEVELARAEGLSESCPGCRSRFLAELGLFGQVP